MLRYCRQHSLRILCFAMDAHDPLRALFPRGVFQNNALQLLSSEPFRRAYPFASEFGLG